MNVISRKKLVEFWEEYPDAQAALAGWYKVARKAKWAKWADVQAAFPKASLFRCCFIFNICGNEYRLVVRHSRSWATLWIVAVMTHSEYDRDVWKKRCDCQEGKGQSQAWFKVRGRRNVIVEQTDSDAKKPGNKAVRGRQPKRNSPASAAYLALVRTVPLLPIGSDAELDRAIAMVDRLLGRTKPLRPDEQGYLEVLSREIERYEEKACPIPDVAGADLLRFLIEQKDVSLTEVADATGIVVSTISAILAKKRKLRLEHLEKLAPYFGVELSAFL